MGSIARNWLNSAGLLFTILATVAPAHSRSHFPDEAVRISACIKSASRGALWLERTLWALRDQEGGWIGAAVSNTNGTHDLGPLQINSWWVPRIAKAIGRHDAQVRIWLQFDACFNVEAARWIFLSGLTVTGNYWKAVGIYHSPIDWRQRRYALSVSEHLRRRFGANSFARQASKIQQVP